MKLPIRPGYQLNVSVTNFEVSKFVSTFFLVNCSFYHYVFNILHRGSALFREAVPIQGVPSVHLFFFFCFCTVTLFKWVAKVKL